MELDKVGGRKFILAMLVVVCTTALMYFGKISDGVYSTIAIAVVGTYIAGNVVQKTKLEDGNNIVTPPK